MYRQGRRQRGSGFALIFMANGLLYNRLGVSMHGKFRGSVRRNRTKRIIKEVFRLHRDLFPPSCDIVLTVSPGFRLNSSASVQEAVAHLDRSRWPAGLI